MWTYNIGAYLYSQQITEITQADRIFIIRTNKILKTALLEWI